ncbi:ZN185 protein, partial [Smithornis capensis]|nr:ZN185 protein [Smithornis capensis]
SRDSLPRDPSMSLSQRSHRVPFYMDTLNYNSTRKGILFVKEYVNTGGFSSPRYGRYEECPETLVCPTRGQIPACGSASSHIPPRSRPGAAGPLELFLCPLPAVFIVWGFGYCPTSLFSLWQCGICHKAMGDLLDKIFIHRDIVHCDKCYEKLF